MKSLHEGYFGEGHDFKADRSEGNWTCQTCGLITFTRQRAINAQRQFKLIGHSNGRSGKTLTERRMEGKYA